MNRNLYICWLNRRGAWIVCLVALLTVGLQGPVRGEALPKEARLSLALATKAAQTALAQCTTDGYRVSVTVVDRAGIVRAMLREDGAGPHTVDSSRKKAYTSASMRRSTSTFAELIEKMPSLQGLRDMNENILILGGGLPIVFDEDVVGGIGVGGAPGAHLDTACARAGLKSIHATVPGKNSK